MRALKGTRCQFGLSHIAQSPVVFDMRLTVLAIARGKESNPRLRRLDVHENDRS